MVWDDETIRVLRDLWAEGLSTAEIGRRLSVSKNAIVGKAHRLELDARPSPIRRDSKPVAERPPSIPRMAGPTLPPLASADAANALMPAAVKPNPAAASSVMSAAEATGAGVSAEKAAPEVTNVQPLRPAPVESPKQAAPPVAIPSAPRPAPSLPPVQVRRSAPSCCWPIGDPGTKNFRFCDDLSLAGKPYCDEHAKLAYVKIRDRREDAA
jgi:GcrA cell cycle regulator